MFKDIKDVFQEHNVNNNIVYDKTLFDNLSKFRLDWLLKDSMYIEFLSSNLTGVQSVRFSSLDEEKFFNILNIDKDALQTDLYTCKDINKAFKVSSNATYLTLMYLMHTIYRNNIYPNPNKIITDLYLIFAYKALSSLLTHYFPFNVSIPLANAVVDRLSNQFLIKKYSSWQDVLEFRAKDILPGGINYKKILNLSSLDATKAVADLQGRLRDIIKNIAAVTHKLYKDNERINVTSMHETIGDDDKLVDLTNREDKYVNILNSKMGLSNEFLDKNILHLICLNNKNIDSNVLSNVIIDYADYNLIEDTKVINSINSNLVVITLNILKSKGIMNPQADILKTIAMIKGYYSNSMIKNKELINIKKTIYDAIEDKYRYTKSQTITILGIHLLTYISSRIFFT